MNPVAKKPVAKKPVAKKPVAKKADSSSSSSDENAAPAKKTGQPWRQGIGHKCVNIPYRT